MGVITEYVQRRNREIGAMLAAARRAKHRTVTECAGALETTRRRYRAIERGDSGISASELEVLAEYLQIPGDLLLPNIRLWAERNQVVVQARPGDVVRLVIQEKPSEADSEDRSLLTTYE